MSISATKMAGLGLALVALVSCSSAAPATDASPAPAPQATAVPASQAPPTPSRALEYTEQRLLATDSALTPPAYPVRTNPDGSWLTRGAKDWTSGFYAAALWKTYERTHDPSWRRLAETWQAGLETETAHDDTGLGFKLFDTYGVAYQLTGDESYKKVVLRAADTVARRYDPDVGMFRVWDDADDTTQYQVNIDALMNLELMFWAGQNGGNPEYSEMANHHALRTLQDLVRPDNGTWMFGGYDQNTGALVRRYTEQGYAADSTWARGQAWAVYGFTMAYRYTRDVRFLDGARRTADYFLRRLPPDQVPYWDFDVPDKAIAPRDTSASAVTASALLELSSYETDPAAKQHDIDAARGLLTALSSPTYAPRNKRFAAMLQHGTQHLPHGQADSGLMFGDYYFVEALARYEKAVGSTAAFMQ
jgi:unsaturated chondroitin disaccharide hydrolase